MLGGAAGSGEPGAAHAPPAAATCCVAGAVEVVAVGGVGGVGVPERCAGARGVEQVIEPR